jgi:uncharacterized metal-binding protein YceD (DUF177 family)
VRRKSAREETAATARPWSFPVALADIPDTGRHFDLDVDAPTRAAVAALAGLAAVSRLQASFDVTRQGADGLRVRGRVWAMIAQTCVVTLEPLDNEMNEDIDLVFLPEARMGEHGEADMDAEDSPEVLTNGIVDLGAIATEFFLLGIDPYPRKPGAVFESARGEGAEVHPFAALAALKKHDDGRKR